MRSADCVLDASAVLAALWREPGAELVTSRDGEPLISAVNLAEVITKLKDRGHTTADAWARASVAPMQVVAFDQDQALKAADLRTATSRFGLSLGDRACLALALRESLPVLTADRSWAALDIGVEIRLIR